MVGGGGGEVVVGGGEKIVVLAEERGHGSRQHRRKIASAKLRIKYDSFPVTLSQLSRKAPTYKHFACWGVLVRKNK